MEIVYFIAFVVVCAIVLMLANHRRAVRKLEDARKQKAKFQAKKAQSDLFRTPASYTLSDPDQPWHTRHREPTTGVARTNAFVARSLGQDPEYDGYSRRDRHHVRDRNAHIKEEGHIDEPRMKSIDFPRSQSAG